ncbi:MAG: DUF952 domain-containing protein [Candidatus Muiribacteriaceae bacterium]
MLFLLHVADRESWKIAKKEGQYKDISLNKEGYIHCSSPAQITKVVHKNFRNRDDLEILVIDPSKVKSTIRYEEAPDGELYPHIYGPVNTDAIIKAIDMETDKEGKYLLPEDISGLFK